MNKSKIVQLKTIDGKEVEAEISLPANIESFFVFSLHKSGSSLLNKMMRLVCEALKIPMFEPELVEYNNGLSLESLDPSVQKYFQRNGFCFSGFRSFPNYLNGFDVGDFKKVLLIRDPRDILVSHYFSHKISHHIPPGELGEKMLRFRERLAAMSIDQYALNMANPLKLKFERYEATVFDRNLKLYRYEDVVFEKRTWLESILQFVGLEIDASEIDSIVAEVDHRPESEDPTKHIRKVTPGDHVEKLQPATIEQLNEIFGTILSKHGYLPQAEPVLLS